MRKTVPSDAVLIPKQAKQAFHGVIYDTYHWQQKLFDGSETTFEMLKRPDTVSTIGITDDRIVVIKDEQPYRGMRLSFPGGRVNDTDTDILTAAKREIHEETGYTFNQWRLVRVWQPQTKIEWFIYLFIAWGGTKANAPHLDAGEKITTDLLTFEEVKRLVLSGNRYLRESEEIFIETNTLSDLLNIPEFRGQEIETTAA